MKLRLPRLGCRDAGKDRSDRSGDGSNGRPNLFELWDWERSKEEYKKDDIEDRTKGGGKQAAAQCC